MKTLEAINTVKTVDQLKNELAEYIYFHQPQLLIGELRKETQQDIEERAEEAYTILEQSDLNIPDKLSDAYNILYQFLKFSPCDTIKDIIQNSLAHYLDKINIEETNQILAVYNHVSNIFDEFTLTDDFSQSLQYDMLIERLTDSIEEYLKSK